MYHATEPWTEAEIDMAIDSAKSGKNPGKGGLTAELLKCLNTQQGSSLDIGQVMVGYIVFTRQSVKGQSHLTPEPTAKCVCKCCVSYRSQY